MFDKIVVTIIILCLAGTAWAVRIARPIQLKHPLDEKQVNELNNILEDIFNMQQGRYETDIVTSTKTDAKNGESWILKTGTTIRLQFKANNQVFTIIPDG